MISPRFISALLAMLVLLPLEVRASLNCVKESISPLNYGVMEAKNGIDCFYALERCHRDAIRKDASISYIGIKSLHLEIPDDAVSIPLPDEVDFAGIELSVLNTQKSFSLFSKSENSSSILVSAKSIDCGRFIGDSILCSGQKLIVIEDGNPWVVNRKGYNYGATRRDVLVIEKGVAKYDAIYHYNNSYSSPKTLFINIDAPKQYKNLKFKRDAKSTKITYLFSISNCFDVTISDVAVFTPQDNNLYGDAVIQIRNSAKVVMQDLRIIGTYSQTNHYGYGINLENVALFTGVRLYARARWGVFGSNNVNGAVLRDCDINRFDIHCYGKDVSCYNCQFSNMYNQFSSVFGKVYFEKCTFTNFIPVLMESSYNAYTPFDLSFKDCTFNLTADRNYLVALLGLEETHNSRPELSRKALPNITIRDCTVNLADDVGKWYIVNTGKVVYKETLDYINKIEVNRLKINGNVDYDVFSSKIRTSEPLKLVRKQVKIRK